MEFEIDIPFGGLIHFGESQKQELLARIQASDKPAEEVVEEYLAFEFDNIPKQFEFGCKSATDRILKELNIK